MFFIGLRCQNGVFIKKIVRQLSNGGNLPICFKIVSSSSSTILMSTLSPLQVEEIFLDSCFISVYHMGQMPGGKDVPSGQT